MPTMTTAERQKLVKAILVANTVPPSSNKIAPTIDLFGNDGTLNIREADGYFDASMLFKNAVHEKIKSVPTFLVPDRHRRHIASEARMTQMGRSCKVIKNR
jgi:hypothetical protein